MQIELLHITECPSWVACLKNLRHSLIDLDLDVQVNVTRVDGSNIDQYKRFQGSPTILVDGRDLFEVDDFDGALSCRVYKTPDGLRGMPTQQQITQSLGQTLDRAN